MAENGNIMCAFLNSVVHTTSLPGCKSNNQIFIVSLIYNLWYKTIYFPKLIKQTRGHIFQQPHGRSCIPNEHNYTKVDRSKHFPWVYHHSRICTMIITTPIIVTSEGYRWYIIWLQHFDVLYVFFVPKKHKRHVGNFRLRTPI
jgi:hypothetical protein